MLHSWEEHSIVTTNNNNSIINNSRNDNIILFAVFPQPLIFRKVEFLGTPRHCHNNHHQQQQQRHHNINNIINNNNIILCICCFPPATYECSAVTDVQECCILGQKKTLPLSPPTKLGRIYVLEIRFVGRMRIQSKCLLINVVLLLMF